MHVYLCIFLFLFSIRFMFMKALVKKLTKLYCFVSKYMYLDMKS